MMAVGTVYAILELFHIPTHIRRVHGVIESVQSYPELEATDITIKLDGGWKGHKAGQFAFVKTAPLEAPHPFTIASDWRGDGKISFVVKSLGDYTSTLAEKLEIGNKVKIEGPYGKFDFTDDKPAQIWIGAGIGITPFIAGLRQLQQLPAGKKIYLYHPTSQTNAEAFAKLRADAESAGVKLEIWESRNAGHLTADRIMRDIPDWKDASVWFCGPAAFMKSMRRSFRRAGLRAKDFHNELFEMR
jgi:predicted ferric reductase